VSVQVEAELSESVELCRLLPSERESFWNAVDRHRGSVLLECS
jgi:hypothetical protein